MVYKQVKISEKNARRLSYLGLTANKALNNYLLDKSVEKTFPVSVEKKGNLLDLRNPESAHNPQTRNPNSEISNIIGNPNKDDEIIDYILLCISSIHNFLWKTQTINGYKNPSSFKINQKAKLIFEKMKKKSENF